MTEINIRYIKLLNNEELYTEVVDSTSDTIVIQNPLSIKMMYDSEVGVYMSISDWIFSSPMKTFTLNKNHIVVSTPVTQKIKEQYLEYLHEKEVSTHTKDSFIMEPTSDTKH